MLEQKRVDQSSLLATALRAPSRVTDPRSSKQPASRKTPRLRPFRCADYIRLPSRMPEQFQYDVFLSHSTKDKAVVRPLAERLRKDGLKVWFDDWEIKAGDSIPAKIDEGLEHSHVLVFCMSANAFGSDWAQLERYVRQFDDPLNKARRLIPLRLDDAPIKGFLKQLRHIPWLPGDRDQNYLDLLEACRPPGTSQNAVRRRTTIWVLGSYSDLNDSELTFVRKITPILGSAFAARGVVLVSGKSDMLEDLAASCRNVAMSMSPRGPLPIFLDGKLRQTDLKTLFHETIGRIPDLAIVVGGGIARGRVAQECAAAEEAGIPLLPVPATGGAATTVTLTARLATDLYQQFGKTAEALDANDLVAAVMTAVERYAPSTRPVPVPTARPARTRRRPNNPGGGFVGSWRR